MSKYDFQLDIGENTSTGKLISKIPNSSVVLEFGCAAGRMTRYMKEILGCKVYIVEIDSDAYDSAVKYADDGICDDILTFSWLEKFQNIRFDIILFADVLEHLREPGVVLAKAGTLLKDDGQILISIPNITHNDILLKAFNNSFTYSKTGLLDETHVHFWGLNDIQPFIESSGLFLQNLEATYCDLGMTEQYGGILPDTDPFFLNLLNERLCGKIYQFVITAVKQRAEDNTSQDLLSSFQRPYIRSTVYLDKGNGFNQANTLTCNSVLVSQGEYVAQVVINDCKNLKQIRFDPVEGQSCIIKRVSAFQGKNALPVGFSSYIGLNTEVFLTGTDPMLFIDLASEEIPFSLEVHFALFGKDYFDIFQSEFTALCFKEQESQIKMAKMWSEHESEISSLHSLLQKAELEKEEMEKKSQSLLKNLHDKEDELAACRDDYGTLNANYRAYLLLLSRKDALLAENERQIATKDALLAKNKKQLAKLENTIAVYQNRRVVKAADFVWRIIRGIKRRIKRLFGIK